MPISGVPQPQPRRISVREFQRGIVMDEADNWISQAQVYENLIRAETQRINNMLKPDVVRVTIKVKRTEQGYDVVARKTVNRKRRFEVTLVSVDELSLARRLRKALDNRFGTLPRSGYTQYYYHGANWVVR